MKISTNILRDDHRAIQFITTPNGQNLFDHILDSHASGQGAHLLIGSFGTGKSTFLWALEQTVLQKTELFKFNKSQGKGKAFHFLKLIGTPASFEECLRLKLEEETGHPVPSCLEGVQLLQQQLHKAGEQLVILVDEFGKHLEYAQQLHGTKDEIYFLQQLAEAANHKQSGFLLIATLHQNIESYTGFHQQLKNEWRKVAGRFIEHPFNEPVEHLFQIAAKKIGSIELESKPAVPVSLNELALSMSLFGNGSDSNDIALAEALAPLDWLSANLLFRALKDYGQNERSLFGFLESEHSLALQKFRGTHYGVQQAFKYLLNVFGSKLQEYTNPHRSTWESIDRALERASALKREFFFDYELLIQLIGLVHLFGREGQLFNFRELSSIAEAYGMEQAEKRVQELKEAKIITFFRYRNQLSFLEGTDMDLAAELALLHAPVAERFSPERSLKSRLTIPAVLARQHFARTGAARFVAFEVLDSETRPSTPEGFYDLTVGVVLDGPNELLKKRLTNALTALAFIGDHELLSNELLELEKLYELVKLKSDDIPAKRILHKEISFLKHRIEQVFFRSLYSESTIWYINEQERTFPSERGFLKGISALFDQLYSKAPAIPNDLFNREKLSSSILTARKKLIHDLLTHEGEVGLGYLEDKYPAERSIFLSLIVANGMYRDNRLTLPEKSSSLWPLAQASIDFLQTCILGKRNLSEMLRIYEEPPFKLKKGLQEFWTPIFLLIHRYDIGLYHINGEFIPYLSEDILDRIHKKPSDFLIRYYSENPIEEKHLLAYLKVFPDGEKQNLKNTYMSIYGGLLTFMRGLPEYAKKTQKLSLEAIGLREEVTKAEDPSACLFDRIPMVLGVNGIDDSSFENALRKALLELRQAFPQLLQRVELILQEFIGKRNNIQESLRNHFQGVNRALLTKDLRILFERIMSPIDDYSSWVKSIADAIHQSNIERLVDADEARLLEKLKRQLQLLENQLDAKELLKSNPPERVFTLRLENAKGEGEIRHAVLPEVSEMNGKMLELVQRIQELPMAERIYLLREVLSKEEKN